MLKNVCLCKLSMKIAGCCFSCKDLELTDLSINVRVCFQVMNCRLPHFFLLALASVV